ncbi:MAG TPA: hypothetical protein VFK09_11190 [Gemmatimonadales bacterium]|jgi:hypothetical protein|nr:hypothetical protein [Gemmatimonadales bacterium]
MSQQTLVVRRLDRPGTPYARAATIDAATILAARGAAAAPGALFEILESDTSRVRLRVRAESPRNILVQQPQSDSGDAWPDPPPWQPLPGRF